MFDSTLRSLYAWEGLEFNPQLESCWLHVNYVVIEELWVNRDSVVQMGSSFPDRENLTHIRTYLPWLRRLKIMYPWLKFIWSFHRNPTDLFAEGTFWKSLVDMIYDHGRDLFGMFIICLLYTSDAADE